MKIFKCMPCQEPTHAPGYGSELTRAFTAWVYNVRRIRNPFADLLARSGAAGYREWLRPLDLYCYRLDVEPPLTFLCVTIVPYSSCLALPSLRLLVTMLVT